MALLAVAVEDAVDGAAVGLEQAPRVLAWMATFMYIYIYIHIYVYGERERERITLLYIYIYIYNCVVDIVCVSMFA